MLLCHIEMIIFFVSDTYSKFKNFKVKNTIEPKVSKCVVKMN